MFRSRQAPAACIESNPFTEARRRYRRIGSEAGVHRETVSRYDQLRHANPATEFAGSAVRPRSSAAIHHGEVIHKVETGG
jgi:hypothetical protein